MIFVMQFGMNKHSKLHSSNGLMQFFVVFEKLTCAYLFQIALKIIWLPIRIRQQDVPLPIFNQNCDKIRETNKPSIERWTSLKHCYEWWKTPTVYSTNNEQYNTIQTLLTLPKEGFSVTII